MEKVKQVELKNKKESVDDFHVGDTVDVHFRISEENKTRVQIFTGIVIAKKAGGANASFTVRRISYGEGVERVFPLQSPLVEKIVVKKLGKVRRAKLYYLRGKKGKKATKVKEKVAKK